MIVEIKDSTGTVIDWYEENQPTLENRVETVENKSLELEEQIDMLLSGVTSDE